MGMVPGFLPSSHGLHFANRFAPGPTVRLGPIDPRWIGVGDASAGLCGGMARYVRERFEAGQPVPPEAEAPANGSPLFRALVRRQVESLDWLRTPLAFWWAGALGPERAARRTRQDAWPRIRGTIDGGRLAMVGLVRHGGFDPFRLSVSHQVLGYGYDVIGEAVTLRVYDPNHPDDDAVSIVIDGETLTQSTGEPLVGLLALERGATGLEIRPREAPGRRSGRPRTGRPARRHGR